MKTFYFLCLLFGLPVLSLSQGKDPLVLNSADEAISLGLKQNPDLEIYKWRIEKSRQDVRTQHFTTYIPNSNLSLSGQYNIDRQTTALPGDLFGFPGQTRLVQMGTKYNYSAGINVSQDLFNFQNQLKIRLARLEGELQQAQANAFTQKLKEQISTLYYGVLITDSVVKINQATLQNSDSTLFLTQQKFQQGLMDLAAVNLAQAASNNARQTLQSNAFYHLEYLAQLKLLLGLQPADSLRILGDLEPQTLNTTIGEDPSLSVYRSQTQLSALDLKTKKSTLYPRLSLNGFFGYQRFTNDWGLVFGNRSWTRYNYIGLNFSLPLTSAFASYSQIKSAQKTYTINQKLEDYERAKSQSRDQLLQQELQSQGLQMKWARQSYDLIRQNLNLSLQKYQQGLISLDTYLRTYEDYLKAESNYLNTLSAYYSTYSTLRSRQ